MKMLKHRPNKIWIDADACPKAVKEIVFKTSRRLNIRIILVANAYQLTPRSDLIELVVVHKGFDAADQHIIDQVEIHDIVITADIPLAAEVLKKKAIALNPRGEIYNQNNIGSILSMRNFMKELRDAGSIIDGPAAFGPKDVKQFADSLNKLIS
jgi:uncharacterized protein YaiI (UPF0178 family)